MCDKVNLRKDLLQKLNIFIWKTSRISLAIPKSKSSLNNFKNCANFPKFLFVNYLKPQGEVNFI